MGIFTPFRSNADIRLNGWRCQISKSSIPSITMLAYKRTYFVSRSNSLKLNYFSDNAVLVIFRTVFTVTGIMTIIYWSLHYVSWIPLLLVFFFFIFFFQFLLLPTAFANTSYKWWILSSFLLILFFYFSSGILLKETQNANGRRRGNVVKGGII